MTRNEAEKLVAERWNRLEMLVSDAPSVFHADVDNMLAEHKHDGLTLSRLEVAVLNAELSSRLSAEDRDPEPENERFR